MMGRLFKSRALRAACALALAAGLVPVQVLAARQAVPAYADESVPAGATAPIPEYLGARADRSLVGEGDLELTGFTVSLKQSYADSKSAPGETIDGMFEKHGVDGLLATVGSDEPVYQAASGGGWLVALVGNEKLNRSGEHSDICVTDGNDLAPADFTDRCRYEAGSGLLYLPRSLFADSGNRVVRDHVNAQTLVRAAGGGLGENMGSECEVTVSVSNASDEATAVARTQVVRADTFDVTTTVPLVTPGTASTVSLSDLEVHLNGNPGAFELRDSGDDATAVYDPEGGTLTLLACPATISRIDVSIAGRSLGERLFGVPEAGASGTPVTDPDKLGTFAYAKKLELGKGDTSTLKPGALYEFHGGVHRHYPSRAGEWEYDVRAKTRGSVYVSCKPTGGGIARAISNEDTDYDWSDLEASGGAHHIDGEHGFLDFFLKMPTGDGVLKNKGELSSSERKTASKKLNFDNWTPVKTDEKGDKRYFVAGCSHSSKAIEVDDDSDANEVFRVLKVKKGTSGYIVFGVAATAKVEDQQGYGIIKVPAASPERGWCNVRKTSWKKWNQEDAENRYVDGNSAYGNVGDSTFGLYRTKADAQKRRNAVDTWKARGYSKDVEPGEYWVAEVKAAKGYLRSGDVKRISVPEGAEASVSFTDPPRRGYLEGSVVKVSEDGLEQRFDGSLAGAKFELSGPGGKIGGYFVTDHDGVIRFDKGHYEKKEGMLEPPYDKERGVYFLPLGTWKLREVKAPSGFALPAQESRRAITLKIKGDGANGAPGSTTSASIGKNKGSVVGNTGDAESLVIRFAEPPRTIRTAACQRGASLEATEAHGVADTVSYSGLTPGVAYSYSEELHVRDSSGNDLGVLCHDGAPRAVSGTFTAPAASGSFTTAPIALPADTADAGSGPYSAGGRTVKLSEVSLVFFCRVSGGDLDRELVERDIDAADQTISFTTTPPPGIPSFHTRAGQGGTSLDAAEAHEVTDTLVYSGLTPGVAYSYSEELHVRDSSGNDLGVLSCDGSPCAVSGTFTPAASSGSFSTDPIALPADSEDGSPGPYTAGGKPVRLADVGLVFFAAVSGGDLEAPLVENDIDAADQRLSFSVTPPPPGDGPSIHTAAAQRGSALEATESHAVTDAVSYTGLTPGVSYSYADELHVRDSEGNDLGVLSCNGSPCAVSGTFTAAGSSGSFATDPIALPADTADEASGPYSAGGATVKLSEVDLVFFCTVSDGDLAEDLVERDIDEADQTLSFTTTPPPPPEPDPGFGQFTIYKHVVGDAPQGERFAFRLVDEDGRQVGSVRSCGAGESITFETPVYKASDEGTHELTLCELDGGDERWSYDTVARPVSVDVSVEGESVAVSCSVGGRGATFENSYTPSGGVRLRKVDDAWGPLGGVMFDVSGPTETSVTTGPTGIADTGSTALEPGEYRVTERIPDGAVEVTAENCGEHPERVGWFRWRGRYMDPTWSRTCTVEDGQTTDLTMDPVVNPLESVKVSFGAKKVLKSAIDGSDLPIRDGQFAFEVYRDAGRTEPLFADADGKATRFPVDARGEVTFPSVEYDGSKIGATESYYVFEADLGDSDTTYAEGCKRVTVTTAFDDAAGASYASVSYYDGDGAGTPSGTPYAFEDRYTPKGQFRIGKVASDTGEVLEGAEFAVRAKGSDVVEDTMTTDSRGLATSRRLKLGTYEAVEVRAPAGYELSPRVVEVTLSADGQLVDLSGDPVEDEPATAHVSLGVAKTLDGRQVGAGEFSFELRDSGGNVVATAACDSSGRATFPDLSYTGTGGGEADVHAYSIHEVAGSAAGVSYDETVARATVTITRAEGGLQADVAYSKPKRYRISYDLAGGRLAVPLTSWFADGSTSVQLPVPERHGYVFAGWTGANGDVPEKAVTIGPDESGNRSYTAHWEKEG